MTVTSDITLPQRTVLNSTMLPSRRIILKLSVLMLNNG